MKRKILPALSLSLALTAALTAGLYAYDWQSQGLTVVSNGNSTDRPSVTLKDSRNHVFTVVETVPVSDLFVTKILRYKDEFFAMRTLAIKSLTFTVYEDSFEVVLMPASFVIDGKDLNEYLPSGMLFYYQNDLNYDFRMNIGTVFMKIKGLYINEDAMVRKIRSAVSDPDAYIRRDDPDFVLSKLDELEGEIEYLKNAVFEAKYAEVCLANRGFFGGSRPVSREFVNTVLQYKTDHPAASYANIVIEFDRQGMQYSKKELKLILEVFFNEF